MANEGDRKPARVQVLHFPKKAKPRRPTLESFTGSGSFNYAKTLPELRAAGGGRRKTDELKAPVLADPDGEETQPSLSPAPAPRRRPGERRTGEKRRKSKGQLPAAQARPRVEVDTDPALRYSQRKLEEALGERPLGKFTPERIAEVSLFGHRLFEEGRLEEARGVFEGLVSLGVEDAFPHTMLGTVYLALGDQDRALALFEAALTLDPADLAARVYRGEIRLNRGRFKLAVEDLRRAVNAGAAEDPFVDRARRLLRMARDLARRRR